MESTARVRVFHGTRKGVDAIRVDGLMAGSWVTPNPLLSLLFGTRGSSTIPSAEAIDIEECVDQILGTRGAWRMESPCSWWGDVACR